MAEISIYAYLKKQQHPTFNRRNPNGLSLKLLGSYGRDVVDPFLSPFFSSGKTLLALPLGEKKALVRLMSNKLTSNPREPLREHFNVMDRDFQAFARKHGLAMFSFFSEPQLGGKPSPLRAVVLRNGLWEEGQVVFDAEARVRTNRRTVFVSLADQALLEMKRDLASVDSYVLARRSKGGETSFDVTEHLQQVLVDLVFASGLRDLEQTLREKIQTIIKWTGPRFVNNSANARNYLFLMTRALLLAYFDPYFPENNVSDLRQDIGAIRFVYEQAGKEAEFGQIIKTILEEPVFAPLIKTVPVERKVVLAQSFFSAGIPRVLEVEAEPYQSHWSSGIGSADPKK